MKMCCHPRARSALRWCALLGVALALGCGHEHKVRPPDPPANPLLDPADPRVNQQAPDSFRVQVTTSRGEFIIEVHRAWAPRGVDRFYNLVTNGFYDECRFFRVIFGFVAQVGISGDPAISAAWRSATIPDDPVLRSNLRGYVSFAKPNAADSRTTQIFINFGDNSMIDVKGFAPFGVINEDGMYVAARLFAEYGDAPPGGSGPDQARIQSEGNAYLATFFPNLDYIIHAVVLPW
jgi:peptidyl-prolyl cis-trans isomerase A (cyclophilin A)